MHWLVELKCSSASYKPTYLCGENVLVTGVALMLGRWGMLSVSSHTILWKLFDLPKRWFLIWKWYSNINCPGLFDDITHEKNPKELVKANFCNGQQWLPERFYVFFDRETNCTVLSWSSEYLLPYVHYHLQTWLFPGLPHLSSLCCTKSPS